MNNINKFPNPNLIRKLYQRYYQEAAIPVELLSSHWRNFSSKINVKIDNNGNIRQFSGYGFGDLQYTKLVNRFFNFLCNLSYFVKLPDKMDLFFLCGRAKRNLKIIDSYLSYDCFRQAVSLSVIRKHLKVKEDGAFNVLIIGDGYGFLSSLIKSVYPKCRIVLADIGNVLLFQAVNLQKIFLDSRHCFATDDTKLADFIYCPAEHLEDVEDLKYKLIINVASMQEMDYSVINRYFDYMRKYVARDNLFYCCNRVEKKLPEGEILQFHKYPWVEGDIHLVDEEPQYYKYYMNYKWPFVHFFDGKMHSRLTVMKTVNYNNSCLGMQTEL